MKKENINNKLISLVIVSLVFINTLYCQKKDIEKGDREYTIENYYNALNYYLKASKKSTQISEETRVKIANSYYHLCNYELAINHYNKIPTDKLTLNQQFNYAKSLQFYTKYKLAKNIFKQLQEKGFQNNLISNHIKSCEFAIINNTNSSEYDVKKTNITSFKESFGIQFYKNGVVYSTVLNKKKNKRCKANNLDRNGNQFKNLGFSINNNGVFEEPTLFSKHLGYNYHKGSICFSSDNKTMYFTESVKKQERFFLQIFQVELINDKWKNKKKLEFNSDNYSCAHPTISADGKKIYFTSNMPNGYGGSDIYVSTKEGDSWGKPQNLGEEINTPGKELFPFINKNGILYFSSNGHPGYGGLDIFSALYISNKWTKVKNKKKPLNSSADDFSIVVNPKNTSFLLFSSNRNTHGDQDNFYQATKKKLASDTISGVVKDLLTDKPKEGTLVFLLVDSLSGDTIDRTVTNKKGEYSLIVPKKDEWDPERKLYVVVEKIEYEKKIIEIDETYFETDIPLVQELNINLSIKLEAQQVLQLYNIYFETNSAELSNQSKKSIDQIILMLKENKDMVIELSAHTDSRSDADFNLKLSKKRAYNVKEYMLTNNIADAQVFEKSYGESKLLNHCKDGIECSENEHALNRRIEIKILKF